MNKPNGLPVTNRHAHSTLFHFIIFVAMACLPTGQVAGEGFLKACPSATPARSTGIRSTNGDCALVSTPPATCTGNLLSNPGFENVFEGWTVNGPGGLTLDSHSGVYAADMTSASYATIGYWLPTTPGTSYSLSAWTKYPCTVELRFLNASWVTLPGAASNSPAALSYEQTSLTGTAPAGATYVYVLFSNNGINSFQVDDVCLTTGGGSPCNISASVANIQCNDNGTPTNSADDRFSFTLTATNPALSSGYGVFIPQTSQFFQGTYGSPLTIQNVPISTGNLTLNLTDDVTGGCSASVAVTAPAPCSISQNICPGDITLASQAEVDAWQGCTIVEGSLVISGNDITDLSPLSTLQKVRSLFHLKDNALLTDLSGLENLDSVGVLFVTGNAALTNLNGLDGLNQTEIISLQVSDNPNLLTINHLNNFVNADFMSIKNNAALQSVVGLSNLTLMEGLLFIEANPSLTDLSGFSSLQQINSQLILLDNSGLTGITGFGNLHTLTDLLIISSNQNLQNLDGFASLANLEGIVVSSNPSLQNLNAFAPIQSMGGNLIVINNPALSNCCGLYSMLNSGGVGGFIDISGNPMMCSSELEVLMNCVPGGDIDLSLTLLQLPAAPAQWSNYTIAANVSNAGPQTATGVVVKFAKPAGIVYTGGNEFVVSQGTFAPFGNEEWNVGNLPPGTSATLTVSYFLLQSQAPVAYAQVIAANETDTDSQPNNGTPPTPNQDDEASTTSTPPNLTPDLSIADLQIPNALVQQGLVLNYNFDLSNIGTGAVPGNFTVKSYISTDDVISPDDIQDGTVLTGNYGAGLVVNNVPGASTMPANLAGGSYFLIVKIDADGVVTESNEGNNTASKAFTVDNGITSGCQGNLMPNSSFESGLGAWTGSGPHEISADAHSGSKALRLFGNAGHAYRINLPVEPGGTYEMRFWAKCVGTSSGTCAVSWAALPNGGGNAKLVTTNLYDEYFLTFSANPNAGSSQSLEVVLSKSAGNFSVFLDDICLTKVPSACQGDLILETQAEVNAALACPVIDGDLIIRSPFGASGASSDITDLSPLSNIGQVNGFIVLENNDLLTDLDDLHIGYAKGLAVVFNDGLTSMNGVSSLQGEMDNISILQNNALLLANMNSVTKLNNGLNITGNPALQRLDYFLSLQSVGNLVHIGGSPALTDLLGLSNLATVGGGFILENCTSLPSLLGLENLQSVGNLAITQNDVLSDVSALDNLATIQNTLFLTENPVLEDCCVFKDLLTGGGIGGSVTIEDNAGFCNSAQDILDNCDGMGDPCSSISIIPGTGSITIAGASAPHVIIKVFKPNWSLAFECLDGACANPQLVSGLNGGNHFVEVKLFDAGWGLICAKSQTVNVTGGGINLIVPDDRFRLAFDKFYPNPVAHWLNVVLFSPKAQTVTLDFYNQQGRRVHTLEMELGKGRNTLELPVSDWKSGTYNVIARGEGLPAYGRFMKVWEE